MGFFDKIADVAKEVGRPARNIAIGYLTEKIENTRAADARNAKYIELATEQYFNEDRPNFIKQEEERYNNFLKIKRDKGLPFAQFADSEAGGFATTNAQQTEIFLKRVAELKPDQIEAIETSFNERRKKRAESFDEKNAFVRKQFQTMPGGPGDMNVMSVFFPNEGEDIAEVGVKQPSKMDTEMQPTADQPTVDQTGGLLDIDSGNFDIMIGRHATEASKANTFFTSFFVNDLRQPSISFAESDAQYPLAQELLKGYDEAVSKGYKDGKYNYARNRYIERELNKQNIKNYPTGIPETKEEQAVDTAVSTNIGAIPGDGKKFDAETFGQRKEDAPKINLKGVRKMIETTEDQRVDSPANIINEARESIASIMEYDDVKADIVLQRAGLNQFMTSTLDEKKQALIANARQLAKDEIKNIGLNPDNFEL
jgi:hypothetical protein